MFSTTDTIVAIATPAGRGGIGVVRLAGPDAHAAAMALTGREIPFEPRHATFSRIVDRGDPRGDGVVPAVDQAVVTYFPAPHSFTGDDVVEISGHGSPVLLQRIVELAIGQGARLAEPGEFTLRAHLNGRIDLVQAEAIADLVDAVTPFQARAAMDQLEGTLTATIRGIDASLFDLAARLEASLDFPDEGFHFITAEQIGAELESVRARLEALARDGRVGRVIREGRLVVIAGRPNAGKSSLFNALAGAPRAIVTDVAGTTRDVLTERVDIGGLAVTLVDTAGLREAGDAIEAEGVRRAREAQQIAALTIVVIDGAAPLDDEDRALAGDARGPRLIVASKADLPRAWDRRGLHGIDDPVIDVSVVSGQGLDVLRQRIVGELTRRDDLRDPPAISNVRHVNLVEKALAAVEEAARVAAEGATEELILAELSAARASLEEITGRRTPDDLLRHVFSRFCVGK